MVSNPFYSLHVWNRVAFVAGYSSFAPCFYLFCILLWATLGRKRGCINLDYFSVNRQRAQENQREMLKTVCFFSLRGSLFYTPVGRGSSSYHAIKRTKFIIAVLSRSSRDYASINVVRRITHNAYFLRKLSLALKILLILLFLVHIQKNKMCLNYVKV